MTKIIRIEEYCQECPFYDKLYGECNHDGKFFGRRIAHYTCQPDVPIPPWCPLEEMWGIEVANKIVKALENEEE